MVKKFLKDFSGPCEVKKFKMFKNRTKTALTLLLS